MKRGFGKHVAWKSAGGRDDDDAPDLPASKDTSRLLFRPGLRGLSALKPVMGRKGRKREGGDGVRGPSQRIVSWCEDDVLHTQLAEGNVLLAPNPGRRHPVREVGELLKAWRGDESSLKSEDLKR